MIKLKGSNYELKPEIILKIGINEMGKKFSKKSNQEQKIEVNKIISNQDFINDMIKLSGFRFLEKSLKYFLLKNWKELQINNLLYKYKQLEPIDNLITIDFNKKDLLLSICNYELILTKIKNINNKIYNNIISSIIVSIHDKINNIIKSNEHIKIIISFYDSIIGIINSTFLAKHINETNDKYPEYFYEKIIELTKNKFSNKIYVAIFIDNIQDLLNIELGINYLDYLLEILINNSYGCQTITFNNTNLNDLIDIFNKLKEAHINQMPLIRFFIINFLNSEICDKSLEIKRLLLYKSYGEYVVSTYIELSVNRNKNINGNYTNSKDFIYGDYNIDNEQFKLDLYYLKSIKN